MSDYFCLSEGCGIRACTSHLFKSKKTKVSFFIPYEASQEFKKRYDCCHKDKDYMLKFFEKLDEFGIDATIKEKEEELLNENVKGFWVTTPVKNDKQITFVFTVLRLIHELPYCDLIFDFDKPLRKQVYDDWWKRVETKSIFLGTGHSLYTRNKKPYCDYTMENITENKSIQDVTSGS